jgi:hypothetical protein
MTGRKYRLVVSGRELKTMEEPSKNLKDIGLHDNCILTVYLQQLQDNEPVISSTDPMEPEIMRHFEALYQLLDLPESLAVNVCSPRNIQDQANEVTGLVFPAYIPPACFDTTAASWAGNAVYGHTSSRETL